MLLCKRPFWHNVIHEAFLLAVDSNGIINHEYILNLLTEKYIFTNNEDERNFDSFEKLFFSDDYEDVLNDISACNTALEHELELFSDEEKRNVDVKKQINNIMAFFSSIKMLKDKSIERNDYSSIFPKKAELEKYLSSYYLLLRFLFKDISLLNLPLPSKDSSQFRTISEFFSSFPAKHGESIFSPYTSESMLKFYKSLDYACKSIPKSISNQIVKEMIASVYSTKVFRDFRHYMVKGHQTYLVSCENTEKMWAKDYTSLSSYELIKPIRLFGKIRRHVENNEKQSYNIIVIGAIYVEIDYLNTNEITLDKFSPEFKDLCDRIAKNDITSKKNFKFDIVLNQKCFKTLKDNPLEKKFEISDHISVLFAFKDYNEVATVKTLDSIIEKGDLVLFLDCPFLYESFHIVSKEQYLKDWLNSLPTDYEDNPLILSEFGTIQKIQNQLNMLQLDRCEKVSHFERRLHERRIRHISEKINDHYKIKKDCHKEAFVFISSQSSINVSDYSRRFQVRIEKYNAKEICLLHFPEDFEHVPKRVLDFKENDSSNYSIFFSLWDIIVNTDPNLGERIYEEICEKKRYKSNNVAELLSSIKIALSWNESINCLNKMDFSFWCDYDVFNQTEIKDMLQSYFNIIFSNEYNLERSIITCMRNSFYNVFFSSVVNVCQALTFHYLKESLDRNVIISIDYKKADDNNAPVKKALISTNKKAYIDVIENLSKVYPSGTIRDVLVLRMRNSGLNPVSVYDNILRACEELKYTESNLYNNIKIARSDLF